ncbi:MAG: sensor histidine kinase [Selenomonadaceae bacterium]|nr:sensor histidine kinase [Selenomonadaceae bacterium]
MILLLVSATIALTQILNACLRWLPFSKRMTLEESKILWKKFLILAALLFVGDTILFQIYGLDAKFYKLAFSVGWILYFGIAAVTIREKFIRHIFVFGMHGIWALIVQGMAGTLNSAVQEFFSVNEFLLQGILNIFWLVILWQWEKEIFINLLMPNYFFESKYRWFNALLPLVILAGIYLTMLNNVLIQPFKERFLRFLIPGFFLIMYRSANVANREIEKKNRRQYFNKILQQQLQNLREYNLIQQENQQQVAIFRHDLRHNYRLISAMVKEGKFQAAIEHIQIQNELLGKTDESEKISANSILNAVILTYQAKAQNLGITATVDIQAFELSNEGDFTIVVSNLFDNAISASLKQSADSRKIFLSILRAGEKIFLEISNRCEEILELDEKGLPLWKYGTGMKTLLEFQEKYQAQVNFAQTEDWLKISVSWEEKSVSPSDSIKPTKSLS